MSRVSLCKLFMSIASHKMSLPVVLASRGQSLIRHILTGYIIDEYCHIILTQREGVQEQVDDRILQYIWTIASNSNLTSFRVCLCEVKCGIPLMLFTLSSSQV